MNINKNIMYKKVSVEEGLPPIDEFVVCFYDTGETVIYKRVESSIINIKSDNSTDWSWIARDSPTVHTPAVSKITHWLTEINSSTEEKDYSHITDSSPIIDADYLIKYTINDISINIPKNKLTEIILNHLTKQ
jgi:hypothetical protein